MTIDATSLSGLPSVSSSTRSDSSLSRLGGDFDAFLKLLTAQISNQNPLEPMESSTFVSQLAQLSQVEQAISSNSNLEQINQRLSNAGAMNDVQLIGRSITLATDRVELNGGQADFEYVLTKNADNVSAIIRDLDGTVVREIPALPKNAGLRQSVRWDGLDPQGLPLPEGVYRFEIAALDSEGGVIAYEGLANTTVQELSFRGGQPMLMLSNETEASSALVLAVK